MNDQVELGTLSAPVDEALQIAQQVSVEWVLSSGSVRPCIAQLFRTGFKGGMGGREPHAFIIALDLIKKHGFSPERAEEILRQWNTRVCPPLPLSEIKKAVRQAQKPNYNPYSCSRPELSAFCMGEECPSISFQQQWQGSSIAPNYVVLSGWLPYLTGQQFKVLCSLYRISILNSRGPKNYIPFTFREIERTSGINRKYIRGVLEKLLTLRFLSDLNISSIKGKPSYFRFANTLPLIPLTYG